MMNKLVIYTAIFNNYDVLKKPCFENKSIDLVCFTDSKKLKSKYWKVIVFENYETSPDLKNRYLKILAPLKELNEYDYSIYVDGSIRLRKDPEALFKKYYSYDLVNYRHYARNCMYSEIEQCLIENRGDPIKLFRQGLKYKIDGMPEGFSLSDNTVLLRNHRSKILNKLMNEWWSEVMSHSGRDQVCLPYILWKNNLKYTFFDCTLLQSEYFEVGPHRKEYVRRFWRLLRNYI